MLDHDNEKNIDVSGIDHHFLDTLNQFPEFISESEGDFDPFAKALQFYNDDKGKKINISEDCLLSISKDNLKLDHPYFSLPAGHTCPFAKICKTIVPRDRVKLHGRLTQRYGDLQCYAASTEAFRKNTQTTRWRNKDLLDKQGSVSEMAELILQSIKFFEINEKYVIDVFRVHESGDFYDLNYFDAWMEVANKRKDILFYAYTKSLPFWVERKYNIPDNFKLVASYGGKFDEMISKHDLRNAIIVKSDEEARNLGLDVDIGDRLAYKTDGNFAILLHGTQPSGELAKAARKNAKIMRDLKKKHGIKENEYQGKKVELNKPTKGDVKKYKVFVKDPQTGNVKKVNFGDPDMKIKRDDPERRKAFRARHNCDTATDKTTPRYWSCKFWSKTNVSDLLKEVIEPAEVDVSSIQMNEELSPMIWDGEELKPDVRKALLMNTKRFIEYCDISHLKFEDIILIGSMANYNYNEHSDIDVHIVMDFSQISDNIEFVGEYFKMKKLMWSENLPIQVKGHDVEMYMQHSEETVHSTGVFSLIDNEWISKPTRKIVNINTAAVQLKAADIMNTIDDLVTNMNKSDFLKKLEDVKEKLKKMRKSGLETGGEFSTENLAFKILRNSGYIKKLVDMKHDYMTQELSLDEILNPNL